MPKLRFELVFYESRRYTKTVLAKDEEEARRLASSIEDTDELKEDNEYYELELESIRQLDAPVENYD